ncbi:MAG: hypothetical protein A3E80_05960 [Chlamydiae bacterium RIFCSPHIGHO2_12_FULL_49_9]|nr:MAG: hypothetical protein A3E80_05960 [Chlamydiae bacterium RIFCSPHIGHO2_12_FULL_49_9]
MTDRFQELLNELGPVFNLPLHLDKNNACAIQIDKHTIQLQLDTSQENLFLFTKLTEIPPGKFRENVLQEALIANSSPDPRPGIFAYLAASNHLVLFQRYPLSILNGERLGHLFGAFLELGNAWRKAIESGRPKPLPR